MIRFFKVCLYLLMFSCFLTCPAGGGENSGDINHDSTLDMRDAVLTLPILSGQSVNDQQVNPNGDVNSDGQIGLAETTFVLQSISGMRGDPVSNAFLTGLTLSGPVLNEPFFPMLFDYTTRVANGTTSLRVTPVTDAPSASVRVNGTEVVSGQASLPISLAVGENRVEVLVSAQDPGVSHIYEVLVIREGPGPSSNAALSDLSLSGTRLNPAFAPGTFTYTADVLTYVDQITVSPTAQNPSAAIQVNGSPVVPGQASAPITLAMGDNLITVMVTAEDGTTRQPYHINVSRHGAPSGVAATVYVVDAPASSPAEFITLAKALEHLTNTLNPDQLGEIRIQTTQPMSVTDLAFTCNVIITLDKGATPTIVGPGNTPLTIDAGGSLDISGLNFENPAGFVINSSVGFSATGSQFNADTAITLGSGAGTLSTRSPLGVRRAAGFVSKSLSLNNGIINGGLSVAAFGATQKNLDINNTTAASLGVTGTFTENSFLSLNANLIPELTLNLGLQNQSQLDVTGHTNLKTATATVQMEGSAAIHFKSNTLAALVAEYKGLKGLVGFQNTFVGNAAMTVNTQEMEFNADKSSFNDFKMEVSHASPAGRFGVNLNGFFAEKSFYLSTPDLPLEASFTAGFTDFTSHGPATIFLAGQATLTLDTVRFGAEATFKYNLGSGKVETKNRVEFLGKVFVQSVDQAFEFNGSYNHTRFHDDATWDFASANFIIRFGSGSEVEEGHSLSITGGSHGTGGLKSSSRAALAVTEGEIHMSELNLKGSSGKPGVYIRGVEVPVTIGKSRIKSTNNWAIVCQEVDGEILISDNAEIKGGIFLDGDPDQTGQMIDKQYTVKGNTISHNNPGMSCVHSHAIRNLLIENNEMTATGPGAHGVLVSGGKVTIRSGRIVTSGPPASQAIGTGESAGGHNSIVYAEQVSMITGSVQTGPKGYIKLTDNTFANAKVVDYKEGQAAMPRLLNNPVENNSGLDPDEDIIGSLIDWNDDDHNCPDYPTKCDEWDEDEKECGCREDGVDPPGEPGV